MRHLLFLLLIPCLMAGKANAQVSLEIEGHASFALEDLSLLADGQGYGVLVAATYPTTESGMLAVVGKLGFNQYGTFKESVIFEGDIELPIDAVYQGIPIAGGVRLHYGQARRFYVEGLIGVEIKRGDFDYYDMEDEKFKSALLASFGGGAVIWPGLAIVASFNMSSELWRYANLGLSYRFGD